MNEKQAARAGGDVSADLKSTESFLPTETMSFESAMAELQTIVRKLEEGKLDLEAAIVAYERGVSLRRRCDALLEDARLRIEQLVVDQDGSLRTEPVKGAY